MDNVLESYLVQLKWGVDSGGLARFQGALRSANRSVEAMVGSAGARLLGWGAATTGVFVGLGAGLAGIIDKVAMADQSYRLFALRMFTTQAVGRELSITMKALGASLDQIVWDPELHARAMQLFKDQEIMTAGMGKGFERNMYDIRNLRFEFQRLGVILQYGSFNFVSDLFRDFFPQFGDMTKSFHKFNDWLRDNLSVEAGKLAMKVHNFLVDIYQDWEKLKVAFTAAGTAIVQAIGYLADDAKLKNAKLSITSIAEAITDLGKSIADVMKIVAGAGGSGGHLLMGALDLKAGKKKEAIQQFKAAANSMTDQQANAAAFGTAGLIAGSILPGPGSMLGAAAGTYLGWNLDKWMAPVGKFLNSDMQKKYARQIIEESKIYGVDPTLALAVAKYESGMRQYTDTGQVLMSNKPGSHATGIFQLQPQTAKMLGVHPDIASENIIGGVKYLKMLEKKYGSEEIALEHYYGSKDPAQNRAYARGVMATQVHIDKVIIQSAPNLTPQQHAKAIKEGMQFDIQKRNAQTGGGPFQ